MTDFVRHVHPGARPLLHTRDAQGEVLPLRHLYRVPDVGRVGGGWGAIGARDDWKSPLLPLDDLDRLSLLAVKTGLSPS